MLRTGSAIRSETKKPELANADMQNNSTTVNNLVPGDLHEHDNFNISCHNLHPFVTDFQPKYTEKHFSTAVQQNPNTIMLEVSGGKFQFNDRNRVFLGSFNGEELIKYVVSQSTPSFLPNTNSSNSKEIIEKYICKVELDQATNNYKYHIINHLESPFTGHVEMLAKLYNQIDEFEKTKLDKELQSLSTQDATTAKKSFYEFILILLNHILKIVSILSDMIKNKGDKSLNDKLARYSFSIMYKISTITNTQITDRLTLIDKLLLEKDKLCNVRQILSEKIDELDETVNKQDIKINKLVYNSRMTGGNRSMNNDITSELFESSSRSEGNVASSSSNVNNITDAMSESTTLSDILNTKYKNTTNYSDTSAFDSAKIVRDSILNTDTSELFRTPSDSSSYNKRRKNSSKINKFSYLISNDSSDTSKIIDIK